MRKIKLSILLKKFNYICYYCKRKIEEWEATRDHFWPVKRKWINGKQKMMSKNNKDIVLACRPCNIAKGDLDGFSFLEMQKSKYK